MKLDRVIAVRTKKTIYRDGDRCIKVFNVPYSKAAIFNEASNHVRLEETGLSIPKVLEVTNLDGKWAIVAVIHDYHMKYITAVNKLLALLAEYEEYSTIQHISEKSLPIENGNPVPYYWLIVSYRRLGAASVADDFLNRAEEHLEPADYQELLDRLDGKIDSFTVENA